MTANIDPATPAPTLSLPPHTDKLHAHSVQFYEDDVFLLDGLCRFIGAALGTGGAAIVIATPAHREALRLQLGEVDLDMARVEAHGRYVALDAVDTLSQFMVDGWPDRTRFFDVVGGAVDRLRTASQSAHARIAAFGEMVAILWAEGSSDAAMRLEQLWNELALTHAFHLHCAYPMRLFARAEDADQVERVCAEHDHVQPTEHYTALLDDDARMRNIALLQQKAQALEAEVVERKRVEEALLASNEELARAVAARDEFLSVAAHELKTPITTLQLAAQGLLWSVDHRHTMTPERIQWTLQAMALQTEKMTRLVGRLLDRGQIEAGKLHIDPIATDLVGLVRVACAQRNASARHPLVFEGPERLEALVDAVRFEQVIMNLLDNAITFSPEGGTVTVELGHGEDGAIRLSVTDHGIGVPPEQREAIFARFQQGHRPRYLTGLGLGLYITREIVGLHGGSVWVEDPPHPGSRFVVTLPAANATLPRAAE